MFEDEPKIKEVDSMEEFRGELEQLALEEPTHFDEIDVSELNELDRAIFEEFKALDIADIKEMESFIENFNEYRDLISATGNASQKEFVSYIGNKVGTAYGRAQSEETE
jgi:uncharacterized protein YdcH (DUF465 family)